MRVVILGIGNILLSDEGFGVRVVEALEREHDFPDNVQLIDAGTSSMDVLDEIADADLLLVLDVIKAGKAPGEIIRLAGDEVPVFFRKKLSPHQVGLSDVLAGLEFAGVSPAETVVLGVQPESFALGMNLTPPVARQVPVVARLVLDELTARGIQTKDKAACV